MLRPRLTAGKINGGMLSGPKGGCRLSNTSLLTGYTEYNCKGGRDVNMAEREGLGKRSPVGLSSNRPLLQRVALQLNSLKNIKEEKLKRSEEEEVSEIDIKIKVSTSEAWFPELARVLNSAKGENFFSREKSSGAGWGGLRRPHAAPG